MTLYNFMEVAVRNHVNSIIKEYPNVCNCQQCKDDITAITLNNLPPKYIVRETGEIYAKLKEMENQFDVDIIKEVTKAIKIVDDNPRH